MNVPRLKLLLVFLTFTAVNFGLMLWWSSGGGFAGAWAAALGQGTPTMPSTFSYQGILRNADGSLADGVYNLQVNLWDAAIGGTALYQEYFANVPVRAGVFSLVIGETPALPANLFTRANIFLGLQVNHSPDELLPRQRLHAVPWAFQAANAVTANSATTATAANTANVANTATTANNLQPGGGVPGLVTFGANGLKEIAFGQNAGDPLNAGKVIYSSSALSITGSGTNKVVAVDGALKTNVIRDTGDSKGNPIQRTTYPMNVNRYVVEAKDDGSAPDSVPVDDQLLQELCKDADGCSIRIGMRGWDSSNKGSQLLTLIGTYHFSFVDRPNGTRYWRRTNVDGAGFEGVDKNGAYNHVLQAFDCYFTDASYTSGSPSDNAVGFTLLNWHDNYLDTNMVCVLTVED